MFLCILQMESSNLEQKIPCACNACKYQVSRKRRICNEYIRRNGMFDRHLLENLRYDSYSQTRGHIQPINIAPTLP